MAKKRKHGKEKAKIRKVLFYFTLPDKKGWLHWVLHKAFWFRLEEDIFFFQFSLIKMVFQFCKKTMRSPTWSQIVYSVRRNFGGLPSEQDPVQVFEKYFPELATNEVRF